MFSEIKFTPLKFGFSEKATKFEKIFVILLTRALCSLRATLYLSKSRQRFFKTNVVKSYYTNFTTDFWSHIGFLGKNQGLKFNQTKVKKISVKMLKLRSTYLTLFDHYPILLAKPPKPPRLWLSGYGSLKPRYSQSGSPGQY